MNTAFTKMKKVLAITVVVWQIPMLMLWKLVYDLVKYACHEVIILNGGQLVLEFRPEQLGKAILSYLPMILALLICLFFSVLSLIWLLKRKDNLGITWICVHGISLVACGVLICAFVCSRDPENLSEYLFFRYFMGSELNLTQIIPFWEAIKYIFVGIHAVLSGALVSLGIIEFVNKKRLK